MGKSEYVLCTIRWDSVLGVLMVTPDFTSISASGEQVNKEQPYHIEVDGDARNTYHYWIEHASPDISQEESHRESVIIRKVT